MQRDPKLIKDSLIAISNASERELDGVHINLQVKGYEPEHVQRHFRLMQEDGLIIVLDPSSYNGIRIIPQRLTNDGYTYLERVSRSSGKVLRDYLTFKIERLVWLLIGVFGTLFITSFFNVCIKMPTVSLINGVFS